MNVLFFSAKSYDESFFTAANHRFQHRLKFLETRLTRDSVNLISDENALCVFVNDTLDRPMLSELKNRGIRIIALRCAGHDNVDLAAAAEYHIAVVNVPSYSPNAVAEHTVCLMLALNRKIHRAYSRVREGNFSLEGLIGFDFAGKTAGIIGTGRIGSIVARILLAFGMKVLAYDIQHSPACEALGVQYVEKNDLFTEADVISLHCPLTDKTRRMIDAQAIARMKNQVMLINTSRGAVLDTCAVITALKQKKIGYLGLDVYEHERDLFFRDRSCEIIQDDLFERLLSFPNVLVTGHQGFFTTEAMQNIASTTLQSLSAFENEQPLPHALHP